MQFTAALHFITILSCMSTVSAHGGLLHVIFYVRTHTVTYGGTVSCPKLLTFHIVDNIIVKDDLHLIVLTALKEC